MRVQLPLTHLHTGRETYLLAGGSVCVLTWCTAEVFPLSVPGILLCSGHYQFLNISPNMANVNIVHIIQNM